jgi:hypothetical protein
MLHVQERVVFRLENIVQPLDMEVKLRQLSRERPDNARDREKEIPSGQVSPYMGYASQRMSIRRVVREGTDDGPVL